MLLGLTTTEVIIVLLFCLLMASGIEVERLKKKISPERSLAADLERETGLFSKLLAAIKNADPHATSEDAIHNLIEAIQDNPAIVSSKTSDRDKLFSKFLKAIQEADTETTLENALVNLAERVQKNPSILKGADESPPSLWPPFIPLSETEGYEFSMGSGELKPDFEDSLKNIIAEKLVARIGEYKTDIVEVIGHTDEQPILRETSNLDKKLIGCFNGKIGPRELKPNDNVGLGMVRAVAVARSLWETKKFGHVRILPLSAGQLIEPVDKPASGERDGDISSRRRIEIRLRRSTQADKNK